MEKKIYGVEAFLNRPKALEEEIRGDIDHIASLRTIVEKTTTHLSFTAGRNPSKNEKTFEDVMIRIAEEEAALEEKQKRLVELKLEVENFISRLHKKEYSMILRHRYMEGLEMSSIMMLMHLAKTTAYDLLADALKAAAKLYAE